MYGYPNLNVIGIVQLFRLLCNVFLKFQAKAIVFHDVHVYEKWKVSWYEMCGEVYK